MPSSTLAASERTLVASTSSSSINCFTGAHPSTAARSTTNQWRPHSGRSNGPASPLLSRWARRHQQHDQQLLHAMEPEEDSSDARDAAPAKRHARVGSENKASTGAAAAAQRRQSRAGLPSQLTREEFEALPLAIQRKYFSTLERLRFAQDAGIDRICQHYDEISSHNLKRRRTRQARSASYHIPDSRSTTVDCPASSRLPDKASKRLLTGPEQFSPERRRPRTSVILDVADEAIYKVGGGVLSMDLSLGSPTVPSRQASVDQPPRSPRHRTNSRGDNNGSPVPDSFYESFRGLDEDTSLDLRLFLDDYHANLREDASAQARQHRPSFRRHLSISKVPFSRSSTPVSRPATRDATASPVSETLDLESPKTAAPGHARRKSRALSLITPKHAFPDSCSAIDTAATHYQDPEARLKLRVYLASPQKFDEAIEFGFPSTDTLSAASAITKEARSLNTRHSTQKLVSETFNLLTFLDDEDEDEMISMNSDQPSLGDPESPRTPQALDRPVGRPPRLSTDPTHAPAVPKPSDLGYAQAPVSSREMTLRMTLTRPDLRAHDEQIYGWQKPGQRTGRTQHVPHLRDSSTMNVTYTGDGSSKESIDKDFVGIDHWNAVEADSGVMKRIWNRVRRS